MADELTILWLQSAGCGGCSISLLNAEAPDLHVALQSAGARFLWHPSLNMESGAEVLEIFQGCLTGETRLDVLCVEGSILRGPHDSGKFHILSGSGKPMMHWVEQLARVARYTLAIGNCTAFGGINLSQGNPTGVCGLQYERDQPGGLLSSDYRSRAGLPVINISGCPPHPNWVTETLILLSLGELGAEQLDALGRPRHYSDHLVHHGCPRNEYYEFKASAEKYSELGCLMENMGCKGTQAHADCNMRLWNGEGSCARGGFGCIGCTEPGFEDPGHPFMQTPKLAGIPIGLPTDMPKAWFVALASLSKSATPKRVRENAHSDHVILPPMVKKARIK